MTKTAGIIIIGDEILNGSVTDTNSTFLCKRFRALGVVVQKISTIPDDVKILADEITLFSQRYDIVITSGGVGPTHDDVTYESVAAAFDVKLTTNKELKQYFDWYLCKGDVEGIRLVNIPSNAEVLYVELDEPLEGYRSNYPIVKTRNVYNFPGIPNYLEKTFMGLESTHFVNNDVQFFNRVIYLNVDEISVASVLREVADRFKDNVMIGSYPSTRKCDEYATKITINSTSCDDCLNAEKELLMKISPAMLIHIPPKLPDFEFMFRLSTMNHPLSEKIRDSFRVIKECFSKYPISDTFIGFNGGKDCTVLLNLLCCYCIGNKLTNCTLTLIYFKDENSFPELDQFIEFIKNNYKVRLIVLPTPMMQSLADYLKKRPGNLACFLGLRSNDPRSADLKTMQETDGDWPILMRVFPILTWNYKDIWDFLRCANIPYCSLYDKGYTSLGHVNNTRVNEELKFIDEKGSIYFRPAFLLDEEKSERNGR
ncbi:FAD synthase-like [Planococcus citri]|uniref:FAD synthase-like n=1 Tax=Planococcus citri TaxID=170843 RepID=UPI0031F75C21